MECGSSRVRGVVLRLRWFAVVWRRRRGGSGGRRRGVERADVWRVEDVGPGHCIRHLKCRW
jgi:hypothetical protein